MCLSWSRLLRGSDCTQLSVNGGLKSFGLQAASRPEITVMVQKFSLLLTVKNSNIGSWAEVCTAVVMCLSLELAVVSSRVSKPSLKGWQQ